LGHAHQSYHFPPIAENGELSGAMYLANLHRQKDQEAANVSAALMVGIAAMIGALATWPWSMVSAFAAIAALGVVAHVNILRPLLRRKKMKKPVKALCVIPSTRHHECDFADQDAEEHLVRTITLPSDSEAIVDFWFQPRLFFSTNEINLGCEGNSLKFPMRRNTSIDSLKKARENRLSPVREIDTTSINITSIILEKAPEYGRAVVLSQWRLNLKPKRLAVMNWIFISWGTKSRGRTLIS
jgi:hypothetical protein